MISSYSSKFFILSFIFLNIFIMVILKFVSALLSGPVVGLFLLSIFSFIFGYALSAYMLNYIYVCI